MRNTRLFPVIACNAILVLGCSSGGIEPAVSFSQPKVETVAEGLLNPVGMAELPDGRILVAEEGTGGNDDSAGVSIIETDGAVKRVISGLPSSVDSGDLSGVPFVALDPSGDGLYLAHFGAGRLLTLEFPEKSDVFDELAGPDDLGERMLPLNQVELTNPFDLAFALDGSPVVTDASQNGVAMETPDGRTRFIHRFGELSDPEDAKIKIDAVPTGIERIGSEYYVTLTGGCPFPRRSGLLVAIDGERGQRTILDGLNMPIDIAAGDDGTLWLLEFARFTPGASCFNGEGYEPGSGRLSKLDESGRLQIVLEGLDFPGSVLPLSDGSVLVTEIFAGRVIRVTPNARTQGLLTS